MCSVTALVFGELNLCERDIQGARVLELGSRDVNGGLRPYITSLGPRLYVGVDIVRGAGVDVLMRAEDLNNTIAANTFDLVVSTETLEHVMDWKAVVSGLKAALRPGGKLLVTTRSRGFPLHAYPYDFWRYEPEDVRSIFEDFDSLRLCRDPLAPGIFFVGRKSGRPATELDQLELYSMALNKRTRVTPVGHPSKPPISTFTAPPSQGQSPGLASSVARVLASRALPTLHHVVDRMSSRWTVPRSWEGG